MRIIAGRFKGRRFSPPASKWPTRPTTDIAREGLFNILENYLDFREIRMLDLFGGSGSHTFEALSRGCTEIIYVDRFQPALSFAASVIQDLKMEDSVTLLRRDVLKYLESAPGTFDYVFAGPPYGMPKLDLLPGLVKENGLLSPDGLFVLEHNANHDFTQEDLFEQERSYGGTRFSFFRATQIN